MERKILCWSQEVLITPFHVINYKFDSPSITFFIKYNMMFKVKKKKKSYNLIADFIPRVLRFYRFYY